MAVLLHRVTQGQFLPMWPILSALIPVVAFVVGTLSIWGVIQLIQWRRNDRDREAPLHRNLRRPPGYSLHLKLQDIDADLTLTTVFIILAPLLFFTIHISQSYFGGEPEAAWRIVLSAAMTLVFIAVFGRKLNKLLDKRRRLKLGLEGEMFTGEELNQLMRLGCRVFHDLEYPYGNIDHVVVSHSGVFTVNSKAWSKPKDGNERCVATVDHNKNQIRLPDRTIPIPVDQLEREANWLSKTLSSATGRTIKAEPMLALPGWWVDRIGRSSVYVFNPDDPHKFFVHNRQVHTPGQIQQIAHVLENLARNIEPSFREKRELAAE